MTKDYHLCPKFTDPPWSLNTQTMAVSKIAKSQTMAVFKQAKSCTRGLNNFQPSLTKRPEPTLTRLHALPSSRNEQREGKGTRRKEKDLQWFKSTPVDLSWPLSPTEDSRLFSYQRTEQPHIKASQSLNKRKTILSDGHHPTATKIKNISSQYKTNVFNVIDDVFEEYDILCCQFKNILLENEMSQEDWNQEYFMIEEMESEWQNEVNAIIKKENDALFRDQEEIMFQEEEDELFWEDYISKIEEEKFVENETSRDHHYLTFNLKPKELEKDNAYVIYSADVMQEAYEKETENFWTTQNDFSQYHEVYQSSTESNNMLLNPTSELSNKCDDNISSNEKVNNSTFNETKPMKLTRTIFHITARKNGMAGEIRKMLDAIGDSLPAFMLVSDEGDNRHFDVNQKNALHYVAWKGDSETVEVLIDACKSFEGPIGNVVNLISTGEGNYGKTPIFYAITQCRDENVLYLCTHEANLLIVNNKGQTPCSLAVNKLKPSTCQLMFQLEQEQINGGRKFNDFRSTHYDGRRYGDLDPRFLVPGDINLDEKARRELEQYNVFCSVEESERQEILNTYPFFRYRLPDDSSPRSIKVTTPIWRQESWLKKQEEKLKSHETCDSNPSITSPNQSHMEKLLNLNCNNKMDSMVNNIVQLSDGTEIDMTLLPTATMKNVLSSTLPGDQATYKLVDDNAGVEALNHAIDETLKRIKNEEYLGSDMNIVGVCFGLDCEWRPTRISGDESPVASLQLGCPNTSSFVIDFQISPSHSTSTFFVRHPSPTVHRLPSLSSLTITVQSTIREIGRPTSGKLLTRMEHHMSNQNVINQTFDDDNQSTITTLRISSYTKRSSSNDENSIFDTDDPSFNSSTDSPPDVHRLSPHDHSCRQPPAVIHPPAVNREKSLENTTFENDDPSYRNQPSHIDEKGNETFKMMIHLLCLYQHRTYHHMHYCITIAYALACTTTTLNSSSFEPSPLIVNYHYHHSHQRRYFSTSSSM